MKKNLQRKLTLNRETINRLEATSLKPAYGGATRPVSYSCITNCPLALCYACPDVT